MENNTFFATVAENNILSIDGSAVSDSVKFIKIRFSFPETWDGFTKTVVFKNGDTKCSVILDEKNELCTGENECYIPHEVIKTPMLSFAVFGIFEDRKATSSWAAIRIIKGCGEDGDEPLDPTPTEYEQLISLLNNPLANPLTETAFGINAVKAETVSPAPQYLEIKIENEDGTLPLNSVQLCMCGRNLIPYPYDIQQNTVSGITFTDNGDGTVIANGTATEDVVYIFTPRDEITIPKSEYMFSGCPVYQSENFCDITMALYINGDLAHVTFAGGEPVCGEIVKPGKPSFKIFISKGIIVDNLIFKPQLELGRTAHEYEPYKELKLFTIEPENPEPVLSVISPTFTILSLQSGIKISFDYILNLNTQIRRMWEIIYLHTETVRLMCDALKVAFDKADEKSKSGAN